MRIYVYSTIVRYYFYLISLCFRGIFELIHLFEELLESENAMLWGRIKLSLARL